METPENELMFTLGNNPGSIRISPWQRSTILNNC
jgi:hypothetical protein